MSPDGRYSAWFRSKSREGMGVIVLSSGALTGGDTVLSYFGSYTQAGNTFSASVRTERHSPGEVALFGLDNIDISMAGTSKDRTASGVGTVKQVPDAEFSFVLIRMTD